ncbi:MAG TPA: SAM-dependent DNA methyltransferase [Firmicutes bacterium]|nr:SAM-dependent DNA methyltransferase [Bacillota bacterium]
MSTLPTAERNLLEKTVLEARGLAEEAASKALSMLGVFDQEPRSTLPPAERSLRNQLRAVARRLDGPEGLQEVCAYEHWHRMLFARFLAENKFLIHPDFGVPVTLDECAEIAREEGVSDRWVVASRFAAQMLPGIFTQEDPVLEIKLAIEDRLRLEGLVESLPPAVFTSDDGLGWTYQFWQAKRKKAVQTANRPVLPGEIPPVTQLFTEHYMVQFLLQNSLGAWWLSLHPDSPLREGWQYYRPEVQHDFTAWPRRAAEVRVIDPCCGSGHFLVEAFQMLWRMRQEEGEAPAEAAGGVLRENLFGLELDARCVQIAAFALALAAWKAGWPVHKELPIPNVACSGLPLGASVDEWRALANGNSLLAHALAELHTLFANASEIGSLIELPKDQTGDLFRIGPDELLTHLEQALARERNVADPVAKVFGGFAKGALRAVKILTGKYHLAVTNPPFLLRGKESEFLKGFCAGRFPEAKKNLATCFLKRCRAFAAVGGYYALVNPQNWTFLITDKSFRTELLQGQVWRLFARLGPKAFMTNLWDFNVGLFVFSNMSPNTEPHTCVIDAMKPRLPQEKAAILRSGSGLMLSQLAQLKNPDSRVVLGEIQDGQSLGALTRSVHGLTSGDWFRFGRCFWEVRDWGSRWQPIQSTVKATLPYGGREHLLDWNDGNGPMRELPGFRPDGAPAWGKSGIAISLMRNLPVTLYTGELFDNNTAVIIPKDPAHLPAIWAFCKSLEFPKAVREIDQALKVTNGTLVKVPFDLEYWQAEAEKAGPPPEPHSADPTQWLFQGNVKGSTAPLQVAVARLLGYRWPQQPEEDELTQFADADGILCLPPVLGELPAVDRLRALLATAYGPDWSMAMEDSLLAAVGYGGKGLEVWLRDGFFEQHARLFHNRPFIWHIWDGRKDGFSALVNYHGLDRAKLEKLIYSYLGAWVARQREEAAAGKPGADARIGAAEDLKRRLELILVGEAPYDIYVRWKPIEKQPLGWEPDLNDGVRLNIRPFVTAGVLRSKVTINWNKDRGRNPDGSERINDTHLRLEEKRQAREASR